MCRLYGIRSSEPTKVECSLVLAQNALLTQSRGDLRGESHPDGWGIAWYENGLPSLVKHDRPAYADLHFSAAAERTFVKTALAHVRQATIGGADLANTHPFVHGAWAFAHNGTVRAFDSVGPALREETRPDLRPLRRGSTDSEVVFYWLLTRLCDAGLDLAAPGADPERVAATVAAAAQTLDARCAGADPEKPARLNFLLTDGTMFVATRWRNGLHCLERDGIRDCEVCGIPHVHHREGTDYRAVILASEPITHEDWREIPDGALVVVNESCEVETRTIPLFPAGPRGNVQIP
jgi:glutamine amidotransferase